MFQRYPAFNVLVNCPAANAGWLSTVERSASSRDVRKQQLCGSNPCAGLAVNDIDRRPSCVWLSMALAPLRRPRRFRETRRADFGHRVVSLVVQSVPQIYAGLVPVALNRPLGYTTHRCNVVEGKTAEKLQVDKLRERRVYAR